MSRRFTHDDSLAFARLSGDRNPIHLDPVVARRLIFGRTVLHGMHLALAAAEQCLAGRTSPLRIVRIGCAFRRPASAGEPVDFALRDGSHSSIGIEARIQGIRLMALDLEVSPGGSAGVEIPQSHSHPIEPGERTICELRNCAGRLPLWLDLDLASEMFPNLTRLFPSEQLATLLATSRLVGMEAPGMHSLLRSLEFSESSTHSTPDLLYQARRIDERFSLVDLHVDAPGLSGMVSTGMRPKPTAQAAHEAIRPLVKDREFRGERALIIGGSRGLGEATAKLMAAGGADVRFTYHQGQAEANDLARQITQSGDSASCFQYDVIERATQLEAALGQWRPTLLGYFATPHVFAGQNGRFSADLFRTFCDFYVTAFHAVFASLPDVRRVLYPSTIAIHDPQPNLIEYAAAKAAGESVCRSLAAMHPHVRIVCPRFGRLATDQTATLLNVPGADPAGPVLGALRELFR